MEARLLWLLSCSGCFGCLLWLPAFIPYAKVKKLILTHYILFIWKDRCFFFPMLLFLLACFFPSSRWISLASASLPRRSLSPQSPGQQYLCHCSAPGQQHLPDGFSPRRPSQQLCDGSASLQSLRHGAPASNKPHLAERSIPVWLAIWRIWAGFANSQHRDAVFATPDNICAHSSLLQH